MSARAARPNEYRETQDSESKVPIYFLFTAMNHVRRPPR